MVLLHSFFLFFSIYKHVHLHCVHHSHHSLRTNKNSECVYQWKIFHPNEIPALCGNFSGDLTGTAHKQRVSQSAFPRVLRHTYVRKHRIEHWPLSRRDQTWRRPRGGGEGGYGFISLSFRKTASVILSLKMMSLDIKRGLFRTLIHRTLHSTFWYPQPRLRSPQAGDVKTPTNEGGRSRRRAEHY